MRVEFVSPTEPDRIVVTSGRIRAKLDFHIDASDQAQAESASKFENVR